MEFLLHKNQDTCFNTPRGAIEHISATKLKNYIAINDANWPYHDEASEKFHPYFLIDPFEKTKCMTNHLKYKTRAHE